MGKKADPGIELVKAIRTGLPKGIELDEREEALLDLAARQARDVAAAEAWQIRCVEINALGGKRRNDLVLALVVDHIYEGATKRVWTDALPRHGSS